MADSLSVPKSVFLSSGDRAVVSRKYTIFLLRCSWPIRPDEALTSDQHLDPLTIEIRDIHEAAVLYLWSSADDLPDWAHLFLDRFQVPFKFPRKKSVSAVLFCRHLDRVFALCFGNGHTRLNEDVTVPDFGFRIALGSIGERLKSIQKRQVDATAKKTTQSSRHSIPIAEFEFDTWLDLLKGAKGIPENPGFASQVGGQDSLHLTFKGGLDQLAGKLGTALGIYEIVELHEKFSFLNNIRPVRDKRLIRTLRRHLVDGINSYKLGLPPTPELQIDTPSSMDHDHEIAGFYFSRSRERNSYYLAAPDFSGLFDLIGPDFEFLQSDLEQIKLNACNDDGSPIYRRTLEKCLHFEISEGDKHYILLEGLWYRYNPEFLAGIEDRISAIPRWEGLPAQSSKFPADNEDIYIRQLVLALPKVGYTAAELHRRMIFLPGEKQVEACDIITSDFEMIHVKRGSSSEELAHMLNQALVSAALLKKDDRFAVLLKEKLPGEDLILKNLDPPFPKKPFVIFLILGGPTNPSNWPLFSRIRLAHSIRELEAYDFQVAIASSTLNSFKRPRKKASKRKS